MARPVLALAALAVAVAACSSPEDPPAPVPAPEASETVNPAPGLEADPRAPAVQASDPTSVAAAADRLLAYLGAHAEGHAEADTLWGPGGPPAGADLSAEPFRQPDVAVAAAVLETPGEPEGAAGSVYLRVPATLTVRDGGGQTRAVPLAYTLRRVNGVPGAEPWQLRWTLERVEAADG